MTNSKPHLALIDGFGFIFRAYHSLPPLTSPEKIPVGAVYGFTSMIMRLMENMEVTHAALIFDSGQKNFRHDLYPLYKANRPEAPEDLKPQFPLIKEAAKALNIPVIERVGFEADDIIATYVNLAEAENFKVTIVSSDKDLMQLVTDNSNMFDPVKNKIIDREAVKEKLGIYPEAVLDYLSLIGDNSDNIPGVPGIGPKTALELLNQYGTLSNIYSNLETISPVRRKNLLTDNKSQALLSKELASLKKDIEELPSFVDLLLQPAHFELLVEFLQKHGFKSLVARVHKQPSNISASQELSQSKTKTEITKITGLTEMNILSSQAQQEGYLSIVFFYDNDNIALIGCAIEEYYYYLEIDNKPFQDTLFDSNGPNLSLTLLEKFKEILVDKSILKISHNVKKWLPKLNIEAESYDDLMILSYILDNGKIDHDLESILNYSLNITPATFQELSIQTPSTKAKFNSLSEAAKQQFLMSYLPFVKPLYRHYKQRIIEEKLVYIYERLDKKLISVLTSIEKNGILVDQNRLKELSLEFSQKIQNLEKEIFQIAGCEFNIGSPKQLGEILFEKLKLNDGKKLKSGSYSTDISTLEELSYHGHPIADLIIEWRHLSKLRSTYTEALQHQIDLTSGRIHTTFTLCNTSTGRLSSTNPNLQNIPIRSEEGHKIRSAFIAPTGKKLVSADYSQIELRILAHIADIKTLQKAFVEGKDIHSVTASQVFNIDESQVDSELRRKAKTINFGIIYGISGFGLAKRLNIDRKEAAAYISSYFKEYPGIEKYMEDIKKQVHEKNYVKTLLGRKCYFKDINSQNMTLRNFSERAAINAPIQGTAADIIKEAMVKINCLLQKSDIQAKVILQVHDELLFEVDDRDLDRLIRVIKSSMEVIDYKTPITVDISYGDNWANLIDYESNPKRNLMTIQ
jgi:DNA polymerase-1